MFSTVYFAASSVLVSDDIPAALATKILDGQLQEAAQLAAHLADIESDRAEPSHANLQICGDLELLLGRCEEAEETYRRTQKAIRHSRDLLRTVSCRNAGWQACFRNQFNVALTCFKRVAEDKAATPAQRLDSMVGATLVLFHLGCIQAAYDRLGDLSMLAMDYAASQPASHGTSKAGSHVTSESASQAPGRWIALVDMLRRDLNAQHELHCAEPLADHIYWRAVVTGKLAQTMSPSPALGSGMALLSQRLDHVHQLHALAGGDAGAFELLKQYAAQIRRAGLQDYYRSLCLEITLAAIAGRATAVAETVLDMSGAAAAVGSQHARWYLDYLYCKSKILQQQMRTQEFAELYGRYALASIQHVRADSVSMPTAASDMVQPSRASQIADDVSTRLPAKYRRAYRYLMDNLEQKDLSVREVASQIGVTERAMQAAFKQHLGLSPSELIRRQRMERIRNHLLDDDAPVSRVLDVAKKWGVEHRSTLINGYRSVFHEAPSETMAR